MIVRQAIPGVACDRDNLRRITQVDWLIHTETVNHEIVGQLRIRGTLFSFPMEQEAISCPFGLQALHLLRSSIMLMRISGDQSRITMIMPLQTIRHTLIVPKYLIGGPKTVAQHMGQRTLIPHLSSQLICLHRAIHILTNIQMATVRILVPPFN